MEGTESKILNKRVAVFYDDGANHISRKDGLVTDNSNGELELDGRIILQKSRVVRIEVQP